MTNPELDPTNPETPYLLHGRTIEQWHEYLAHDNKSVPCSRFGTDSDECAWFAIACEIIYTEASGENRDEDPTQSLNFYMGLVVNDNEQVAYMLNDFWFALPPALQERLIRAKFTSELEPGDRVRLPGGIVRTVDRIEDSPFVNVDDEVIVYVKYREGVTEQWGEGNSAIGTSVWSVEW